MMRIIFIGVSLFFTFIFPSSAKSCEVPEDTKETVVMTDFNFILQEVETAKKAACEQGKRFVLLPYGYQRHKKLGQLREELYRLRNYYRNCKGGSKNPRCSRLKEKHSKVVEDFTEATKYISRRGGNAKVREELKKLAQEERKITSIVMSGHDGSGHLYGMAGDLLKSDVTEILRKSYEGKEKLLDDFKSIYLWGCYTATRIEVDWWKKEFPQLEVIGGFHGSGPSIGKRASTDILYDLMSSEDKLTSIKDKDEIERALKNLDGLPYLLSGISVSTCGEDWYLSRKRDPHSKKGRLVTTFGQGGTSMCTVEENVKINDEYHEKFMEYFNGKKDLPGELRAIYNHAREWEHCKDYWPDLSKALAPDQVALLLFFDGVKANFFNSFEEEILESIEALKGLPMNELDYIGLDLSFFDWLPKKLKYETSKLKQGEEHKALEKFTFNNRGLLMRLPRKKEDFVKLSRKELNRYNKMLHELTNSDLELYPSVNSRLKTLRKLKKALNTYAYGLDTNCMNMLRWHEDEGHDLYPSWIEDCQIDY